MRHNRSPCGARGWIAGWVFVVSVLLSPSGAAAQDRGFKNYSVENGLAQSQVRALLQDRNGYLWIGTDGGGLDRFDGRTFVHHTTEQGLPDNSILSLYQDRSSVLWVATRKGVCTYDGRRFVPFAIGTAAGEPVRAVVEGPQSTFWFATERGITRFDGTGFTRYTAAQGLPASTVLTAARDRAGGLWIGTDGGGVSRFDGQVFRGYTAADGLADGTVYAILEDRAGRIWFGTHRGLSRYDHGVFTTWTITDGLPANSIRALLEDRDGNIWLATAGGGISRYDGERFANFDESRGLSSNTVWSLAEDREGNIWAGTYRGGLDRYGSDAFRRYSAADGLGDSVVRSIAQDRRGSTWIGTYRGGAAKLDRGTVRRYTTANGLAGDFVLAVFPDSKGNVWFGTTSGLSRFDGRRFTNFAKKDGLPDLMVRTVIEDRAGRIWFGTNHGGVSRFDGPRITRLGPGEGLTNDEIMSLLEDRQGNIWIGTASGAFVFDGSVVTDISRQWDVAPDQLISTILEDGDGHIWFGIFGGGVVEYPALPTERSSGRPRPLRSFSRSNGLSNDNVVSMAFDEGGDLWVGTERGVNRIAVGRSAPQGRPLIKQYGDDEGFTGIECIHNAIWRGANGHMWFGTLRGAFEYWPERDRPNVVEPIVHVTDVALFFKPIDWSRYGHGLPQDPGLFSDLRLPHDQNHLSFGFAGINLRSPAAVRYQYRLDGFESSWSPVGADAHATYSNIPPGRYAFQVRARNGDEVWTREPAVFRFTVGRPWWQAAWFYVFVLAGAAGAVGLIVRLRTRRLERIRKTLVEQVGAQTQELRAAHDQLEARVQARTNQLAEANRRLQAEVKERHEAVLALRVSKERYRLSFEEDLSGNFIATPDGRVLSCNRSFAKIFGFPSMEAAVGTDIASLYAAAGCWQEYVSQVREHGHVADREGDMRRQDGAVLRVIQTLVGMRGEGHTLIEVMGYCQDNTDHALLQSQLLQSQKMEAVGKLAGGVAHDFNNLLTVINGYTDSLLEDTGEDDPRRPELLEIQRAGERAADLTGRLLAFSRRQVMDMRLIDLNATVRGVETMLRRLIGEDVSLVTRAGAEVGAIKADPSQIEHVLMNLAVNARDAMPHGGVLTIETDTVEVDERFARVHSCSRPGTHVRLSVRDTGVGMAADVMERIFEPFFTTKAKGKGTGLGLSVVYGIVKQCEGTVVVRSQPGAGTCFELYFPLASGSVDAAVAPRSDRTPSGRERILLVEDDDAVRQVAQRMLARLGYEVVCASRGDSALEIAGEQTAPFDLLVTDVVMPEMSGPELARRVRLICPSVRVLFVSGYTDSAIVDAADLEKDQLFLQKPFTAEALAVSVRAVLDRER